MENKYIDQVINKLKEKYLFSKKADKNCQGDVESQKFLFNDTTRLFVEYDNKENKGIFIYSKKIDDNSKYVKDIINRHPELFKQLHNTMKDKGLKPKIYFNRSAKGFCGTVLHITGNYNESSEDIGETIKKIDDSMENILKKYNQVKSDEMPYIINRMFDFLR